MNLITNSTFQVNGSGVLYTPPVKYGSGTLTVVAASLGLSVPANYLHVVQATDNTGFYMDITLKPNTDFVFSFFARALIGDRLWYSMTDDQTNGIMFDGEIMLDKNVARYEFAGRTGPMTLSTRVRIYAAAGTGYSFDIAGLQVEEGLVATPFHINLNGVLDRFSKGAVYDLSVFNNLAVTGTLNLAAAFNEANRCQYTYAGGMVISIGSGGVIPFPTAIEDVTAMRPFTVLSNTLGDTDTALHFIDADGPDWTGISAVTAPLLMPIHNSDANTWAVVDTVGAHDLTLSADIFPTGIQRGKIYDPSIHITKNGLYLIDVAILLAATEANKNYKLDVITGFAAPVIIATTQFDTAATGQTILTLSRLVACLAGDTIYVKLSSNCAGTVTLGYCFLTIVKL